MEKPPAEATSAPEKKKLSIKDLILRIVGIVFAVGLSFVLFIFRDRLAEAEGYGLLGLFVISVLGNATVILPMPTIIAATALGSVYNPLLVALISSAGATLGELTGYIAGFSGTAVIENRDTYERFERWMDKYGLWALFVLAVIPNPLFDVAGIIAGLSKMKVHIFFLVTWAGKYIKFLGFALLGTVSSPFLDKLGL